MEGEERVTRLPEIETIIFLNSFTRYDFCYHIYKLIETKNMLKTITIESCDGSLDLSFWRQIIGICRKSEDDHS